MSPQSESSDAYEISIVPSPAQGNDTFEAWYSGWSKPFVAAYAFHGIWVLFVDPEVEQVLGDPAGFTGMRIETRLAALDWVDLFGHRYVAAMAK